MKRLLPLLLVLAACDRVPPVDAPPAPPLPPEVVEAAVAVLSLARGRVPPTLHCDHPDPECGVSVIRNAPLTSFKPACLVVNYTTAGQAVATVLSSPRS